MAVPTHSRAASPGTVRRACGPSPSSATPAPTATKDHRAGVPTTESTPVSPSASSTVVPSTVPAMSVTYGTTSRPGPGVSRPRRITSSQATVSTNVPTAPAGAVPTERLAPRISAHWAAPESRPTASHGTVRAGSPSPRMPWAPRSRSTVAAPATRDAGRLNSAAVTPTAWKSRSYSRAPMRVPGAMDPHGPMVRASTASSAERNAVNPRPSSSGTPTISETPNPVTVSRNGMIPCTISRAVARVGPLPAESHRARRACAPECSITRDRVMPPAMIARISTTVGTPRPTSAASTPGSTPNTVGASAAARTPPAAGATHAGRRVSSRASVSRMGVSASRTCTGTP